MHYVGTEVDTEADADDEDVHAGDLDGDAPPVHEAGHVQAGQEDDGDDDDANDDYWWEGSATHFFWLQLRSLLLLFLCPTYPG